MKHKQVNNQQEETMKIDKDIEIAMNTLELELKTLKGLTIISREFGNFAFSAKDDVARFLAHLGASLLQEYENKIFATVNLLGSPETYLLQFVINDSTANLTHAIESLACSIDAAVADAPQFYNF